MPDTNNAPENPSPLPENFAREVEKTAGALTQVIASSLSADTVRAGHMVVDKGGNVTKVMIFDEKENPSEWTQDPQILNALEEKRHQIAAAIGERIQAQLTAGIQAALRDKTPESELLDSLKNARETAQEDLQIMERNTLIYMAQNIEKQKKAQAEGKRLASLDVFLTPEELKSDAYQFGDLHKEKPQEIRSLHIEEKKEPTPEQKTEPQEKSKEEAPQKEKPKKKPLDPFGRDKVIVNAAQAGGLSENMHAALAQFASDYQPASLGEGPASPRATTAKTAKSLAI